MKYPLTCTCRGEFCNLILALDPDRDLVLHSNVGLVEKHGGTDPKKIISKADRDSQAHDRAYRIVKKVLARSELSQLEESGNLLRLRIPDRIDPYEMRSVSEESILISKREYRSTLLELTMAEEERGYSLDIDDREPDRGHDCPPVEVSPCRISNTCRPVSQSPNGMVAVCSICYHVYNLLHRARTLLSYELKLTSIPLVSGEMARLTNTSPDMRNRVEHRKQVSRSDRTVYNHDASKIDITRGHSTEQQTKSFTPKLNGITDLIDDFEEAKRIILQETSKFLMNAHCHEEKFEGSGSLPLQKKNTEAISIINPDIQVKRTKSVATSYTQKRFQSTHRPPDKPPLPMSEPVKFHLPDTCLPLDPNFMTGILHVEDGISLPYRILGNRRDDIPNECSGKHHLYNMIVCNDIFDTYERFTSIFMPMVQRYPSLQVLLWNYPGQALTTFSDKRSMDNTFFSECLCKLLKHIGDIGTKQFDTNRQFYIMGAGCGGSVALLFASKYREPSLRALFLINPLIAVDSHFASVMHDCRNAFSCSPEARPDIPTYFFSRYLFSTEYLQRISASQALNIYTSDPNPITVKGRIKLCQAALNFVDVREHIKNVQRPIISIHGQNSYLVRPSQTVYLQEGRSSCTTIFQALHGQSDGAVVYMTKGGHELIQERRKPICTLIDQLLTAYHEHFEAHPSAQVFQLRHQVTREVDMFSILITAKDREGGHISKCKNSSTSQNPKQMSDQNEASRWEAFQKETEIRESLLRQPRNFIPGKSLETAVLLDTAPIQEKHTVALTILDPHNPSFERNENKVYQPGKSLIYPNPDQYPRVKELMTWRLRRNEKRLSRFHRAAIVIQKALRMYIAKTLIMRVRKEASALLIQRCFRGMLGRTEYRKIQRELWAAKFVQRAYRGHLGRLKGYGRRMAIACQTRIAQRWRGAMARRVVEKLLRQRFNAALLVQCSWRTLRAKRLLHWLMFRNKCCINIQRIFRGYKGRRKATLEREKYIFSRSQSGGIEIGRRLLAEHKRAATRLQSELSLIDQEKSSIQTKLDELQADILVFEGEVSNLEREMHKITSFEREHPIKATGSGKYDLKEKKIRLDQEFTLVLARISDRKSQLQNLEEKLSTLNSEREEKAGELKALERKLVFLLEEQEAALDEIRIRQKKKSHDNTKSMNSSSDEKEQQHSTYVSYTSDKEKRQAAKLMESTETMMKFGFMSMSMTYFSSLNMIKAMKTVTGQSPLLSEAIDYVEDSQNRVDFTKSNQSLNKDGSKSKVDVDFWDIDQVVQWLHSIHLGQYEVAFRQGSVDGPFLCQLTDEDLRYVLEVEHKLHRKKILYFISQLVDPRILPDERSDGYKTNDNYLEKPNTLDLQQIQTRDTLEPSQKKTLPNIHELFTWIKSRNIKLIQEALESLPDRRFDKIFLRVQFIEGVGTVYMDPYEREAFHLNKVDDHGNTPLHIAAQNGDIRIAKLLVGKGSNPNHQNKQGQTPGHFAVAYQFFDFASWLFDERGGCANDLLANMYGLGPYDGLTKE